MGRHSLEIEHTGTLPADEEPTTRLTPKGHDGASMSHAPTPEATAQQPRAKPEVPFSASDHLSPSVITGLGREAVRTRLLETHQAKIHQQEFAPNLQALNDARRQIMQLQPDERAIFQGLVLSQPQSNWLEERMGIDREQAAENPEFLLGALVGRDEKGRYILPDDAFANFLEWHNAMLAEKQKAADKFVDVYKKRFSEDVEWATKGRKAWFPRSVRAKLHRVRNAPVIVDDGLRLNPAKTQGATQHKRNRNEHIVFLAPAQDSNLRDVLYHELFHVLDGKEKHNGRSDHDEDQREVTTHGLYRVFGKSVGAKALDERIKEQAVSALLKGDVDITDPRHPKRKGLSYGYGGKLLHALAKFGVEEVDIRKFFAADMEEDTDKGRTGLIKSLKRAFPYEDVIGNISQLQTVEEVENYAKKLEAYRETDDFKRLVRRGKLGRKVLGMGKTKTASVKAA